MLKANGGSAELDPKALGLKPWHFIKSSRSVVGPGAIVAVPPGCSKLDWEAELAVVIGRKAKGLPADRAHETIAGYTIANDLSARDLSRRRPMPETSPFYFDWTGQKSFDGACPLGPWIVPAGDLAEPGNLRISLSVNGVVKQDSSTRHMIFDIAEQVSHLSSAMTLWPGDIVLTGTPAGVGAGRGEFLKKGDEVLVTIEGIGELRNTIG
jgi:2-keto-4-pentenoate hydratase/2-oxohepta-3-ene-1,7-dioic acid hydratase in catechol pathway